MSNYIYISFISRSIFNKNSTFSISTRSGAPEVDRGGRWEERVSNWILSLSGWLLPCTTSRSPFPPEFPVGVAMGFSPRLPLSTLKLILINSRHDTLHSIPVIGWFGTLHAGGLWPSQVPWGHVLEHSQVGNAEVYSDVEFVWMGHSHPLKCFTGLVGMGMFVTPIQMVALRQRSKHTV